METFFPYRPKRNHRHRNCEGHDVGEVGLEKSTFQIYRDGFKINTRIAGVDGQKVADLLTVQDVRIDGNFPAT